MRKTVDAYFDDRNDSGHRLPLGEVPPTSIVQVHRYPPSPSEVAQIQRYGSLLPESAARPRKRPLTIVDEQPPNSARAFASIEERRNDQPQRRFASPNKRQRSSQVPAGETSNYEHRSFSRNPRNVGYNQPSQMSGEQGVILQVKDSQPNHPNRGKLAGPHSLSGSSFSWQQPMPMAHQSLSRKLAHKTTSRLFLIRQPIET